MIIGTVCGNVVATRKHDKLAGRALLLVQPLSLTGEPAGDEVLALDTVGAGVGDRVLVVIEGRSTSQAIAVRSAPANAAIVAIVDELDLDASVLASGSTTSSPPDQTTTTRSRKKRSRTKRTPEGSRNQ